MPGAAVKSVTFGKVMGQNNPAPDIGLGSAILAGMGGTVLVAVVFLLVSWAGFNIADKPASKNATHLSPALPVASPN